MTRRLAGAVLIVLISVSSSVIVTVAMAGREEPPQVPESEPPRTAAVTEQRLVRRLVFQGTLERGEQPIDAAGVVSAVPTDDAEAMDSGDVVLELEGRPLIALRMPFPLWRDIEPGDEGRDVEAVQESLADAGVFDGVVDGRYGPVTQAAVIELYERVEYPPPDRTSSGTPLPADEILSVPPGDLRLALGPTAVGDTLDGADGPVLRTQELHLVVEDEAVANQARPGMTVLLDTGGSDRSSFTLDDRLDESEEVSRLVLSDVTGDPPTDQTLAGELVVASTDGDVMAVPKAAIGASSGGTEVVEVENDDGTIGEAEVTVGFRGDELVEIESDQLAAGDRVVVSR